MNGKQRKVWNFIQRIFTYLFRPYRCDSCGCRVINPFGTWDIDGEDDRYLCESCFDEEDHG